MVAPRADLDGGRRRGRNRIAAASGEWSLIVARGGPYCVALDRSRAPANAAPALVAPPSRVAASSAQTLRIGAGDLEKALADKANAQKLPELNGARGSAAPAPAAPSRAGLFIGVAAAAVLLGGLALWLLKAH